jgi:hypothetical protein
MRAFKRRGFGAALNKLFGRTLAFKVATTCENKVDDESVNVFIDDHGRLKHRR